MDCLRKKEKNGQWGGGIGAAGRGEGLTNLQTLNVWEVSRMQLGKAGGGPHRTDDRVTISNPRSRLS